ncbi:small acid-soluble spore protein Tlp [Pontibacillus salicampi]|uniref:Small, acid-soluble spore protein Tlp n=1 Tax=Pontibacillus salicampi TaxID=1449801 RepID=A0ABV6LRF6_9BACI
MAKQKQQVNPDDRSDNVSRLIENVQNTIENIEEAHDSMQFASEDEKAQIEAKNKRREESIDAMRNEIKDESHYQQEGDL